MPQSRPSKFSDSYKQKSGGIDKRALRGLRQSLDRKQSRSEVLSKRRNMEGAGHSPMSPITESRREAAPTKSETSKSG